MIYYDTYFVELSLWAKKQLLVGDDKDVIPVRGPRNYKNGEYEYNFSVDGDLDCFEGKETIRKGKTKVYQLKCHGSIIKR